MKILIADGSLIVAERLTALMSEIPNVELVAPPASGEAILKSVRTHDPEVVVIDARILRGKGRAFIETVRKDKPAVVLIIFSNLVYPQYRKYYEAAGADIFMDISNDFIYLCQFIGELVRGLKNGVSGPSPDALRKRLALTKLKAGIQLAGSCTD